MVKIRKLFLYAYCLTQNLGKGILFGSDISDHLNIIFSETVKAKPEMIVELGTRGGESTRALAKAAKKNNAVLVSVDVNDCSGKCDYENWFFVKNDDLEFAKKFRNWCKEKSLKPSVDVLFIDTTHTYEHTKKEINEWFPLLSKNAVTLFHDTNSKMVYNRIDGTIGIGNEYDRGVILAVEDYYKVELTETKNFEKTVGKNTLKHYKNCNGLLIIRKNNA
ncbi:MAG: class I SAM-dependent methyltransferase [Candidatus Diapherotrites archaeon]|nr:class I SAM-dependent methyltransferase [Candidatus Diapherotrites archaeon]